MIPTSTIFWTYKYFWKNCLQYSHFTTIMFRWKKSIYEKFQSIDCLRKNLLSLLIFYQYPDHFFFIYLNLFIINFEIKKILFSTLFWIKFKYFEKSFDRWKISK